MMTLSLPSLDLAARRISEFDSTPRLRDADLAIERLVSTYPHNTDIVEVLIKVVALNSLYATGILDVDAVARHVHSAKVDTPISQGRLDVVDEIALVWVGRREKKKRRRFYSFASKYCAWHNPDVYPIYDEYVARLLRAYSQRDRFREFNLEDLKSYPFFRSVVVAFRDHYRLSQLSFKELDKYLWMEARTLFEST